MGKKTGLPQKRKRDERITDFSKLSELKIEESEKNDNLRNIVPFDIPSEFIGCNAIVNNFNDRCFLNPFTEEDVQFFIRVFQNSVFKLQLHYDEKQQMIEKGISAWQQQRPKKAHYLNPIEPLLYAIKLTDGIVGSAGNVADPDPKLLDAFANGILSCWDENSEEDNKIISHILVNWNWYQPLLIVIRMYQLKDGYDNPEIDQIIRTKKLFTPDYAMVSFECLANHKTRENAECLLGFVSRSLQTAVFTEAEIRVTKKQRELFDYMYTYSSPAFQEEIVTSYITKYRTFSDAKSRRELDRLFHTEDSSSKEMINNEIRKYAESSGEERKKHFMYLVKNWDLSDPKQTMCCRSVYNEELLDLVKTKTGNLSGYSYGSAMFNLAMNSKFDKCQKYVKEAFQEIQKSDSRWLGCACAANSVDGTPDMDEIAEQFFLKGNGYMNKLQLQWLTKTPAKAKEMRTSVLKILDEIADTPEKWSTFLNGSQQLYFGEYVTTGYVVEIDELLKKSIEYAKSNVPGLALDVIGVIDNVMNRNNRDRYRDMLHEIYHQVPCSASVKKRAWDLLIKYYGGSGF